jgi:DNA-binding NtrC family response regulator
MEQGETGRVLIVDDEELIRWSLAEGFRAEGYTIDDAATCAEALEKARAHTPDGVVLDLKLPDGDGISVLEELRREFQDLPVIMITAHGDIDSAISAVKAGAADFIQKPFDIRELILAMRSVLEQQRLRSEVNFLRAHVRPPGYDNIIGDSSAMLQVFRVLERLEDSNVSTVLVEGESGTGKDLIARALHERGRRAAHPFMEVDCAALPETLIESTLFGNERGAFTDAKTRRQGLFEVAGEGTIFLDEIGEMSLGTQSKLLRALENRRFKRVGGTTDLALKARVIAATNRDLTAEVQAGRFRQDLFYRLAVVPVKVPPLRDRSEDIPLLAKQFVTRLNKELNRRVEGITKGALRALGNYHWPGNVRELRNVIERVVILEADEWIRREHLPPEIRGEAGHSARSHAFTLPADGIVLEDVEADLISQALERTGGNQSRAARLLGLSRYALRYRMQKYGLLVDGQEPNAVS